VARGWESKDVEAQKDALDTERPRGRRLTPDEAARARERESLEMSRKLLARQVEESGNERYREMLKRSLVELDAQIEKLR
jgi:hypothetical protein